MTKSTINRSFKKFKTSNFLLKTFTIFSFSFNINFLSAFVFFIHVVENFFSIFDLSISSFSSIFSISDSLSINFFFFRTNFYIFSIILSELNVIDSLSQLSSTARFNVEFARDISDFSNSKFSSLCSSTSVIFLNKLSVSLFFFAITASNDDFLISFSLSTFADFSHAKISSIIRRTSATFSDSRSFHYQFASLISATFFDDKLARLSSLHFSFVFISFVPLINAIFSVDRLVHSFIVSLTSAINSHDRSIRSFRSAEATRFLRLTSAVQCSVNVRFLLVNDFLLKKKAALNFFSSLNNLNIRKTVDRYQIYIQNVIIDINFICVFCDLFINNQHSHQLSVIDEIYQNCVKLNLFDETELNCCETTTSIYSFCTSCFDNFSKSKVSKFESINQVNSIACQNFSDALKNLTLIEEIVIARTHFFVSILKLRFNDIIAVTFYQRIRDHAMIFSQNSESLLDILSSKNLILHDVIRII